jgi:GNAT superfamily N-acetyltransferase
MIVVDSFANHLDLVPMMVSIAWSEWGDDLTDDEHERWLREATEDARLHSAFASGFVALADGVPVGVVQLHEYDIEEMRDRSPWVCGMVVTPDHRGSGIGRRLLHVLESFATDKGVEQLWVFTESAKAFYEECGWSAYDDLIHDGERGTVLTKRLESSRPVC